MEQYKHYPKQRRSYMAIPPDEATLDTAVAMLLAGDTPKLAIDYGVARVHPLDSFCKRVGRHTASLAKTRERFILTGIQCDHFGTHYAFQHKKLFLHFYKAHSKPTAKLAEVKEEPC